MSTKINKLKILSGKHQCIFAIDGFSLFFLVEQIFCSNPCLVGTDDNSNSKSYWDTFIRGRVREREKEREREEGGERVNIKSCNIMLYCPNTEQ